MQRLWRHREPTRLVRPTILVGPFPASGNRLPSGRNPTAHGHTLSSRSHSASSGVHLSPWSRDDLGGPHRLDRNRGDLREGPTAFPTSLSIRGVANRKYSYPSTLVNTFCCCCACDHVGNAKAEQSEAAVLSTWSQASPSKTARGVR